MPDYPNPLERGAFAKSNANVYTLLAGFGTLVLVVVGMAFPTLFWSTLVQKECPIIAKAATNTYYSADECTFVLALPDDNDFSYAWDSDITNYYSYSAAYTGGQGDLRSVNGMCEDALPSNALKCTGTPFTADNCIRCMYMRPGRGNLLTATIMAGVGYGVFFLFSVPLFFAVANRLGRSHRAMDAIEKADEERASARLVRWTQVQLEHGRDEEGLNASHESLLSRSGSDDRVSRHSASASSASEDESSSSSST